MNSLEIFIEEFNKINNVIALKKDTGGIAKIISKEPMISSFTINNEFIKRIEEVEAKTKIKVSLNQLQTAIFLS